MRLAKRYWLQIFLLLAFLPGLVALGPPQQNDDESIVLEIDAGYGADHYYRPDQWTPIRVTVKESNTSVRGFLQVHTKTLREEQIANIYQVPINIESRSGETSYILNAIIPANTTEVEVQLIRDDGRILKTQSARVTGIPLRDILSVVITESIIGTIDTTRIPTGRGDFRQANWAIDDLPFEPNALRSVDVMILFDVDTGRLSIDQRTTLKTWVNSGGHLIVHGGPGWQRTVAGIQDILPTQAQGTATLEGLEALGDYLARPHGLLANTEVILTRNTPQPTAQTVLIAEDLPLIVRGEIGNGLVDFVAFDPLTEPFASYEALPWLWYELIISAPPRASWDNGIVNWASAEKAIRIASSFDFPSVLQLLGFLGVYVLLIGPVNYLVLRQIGRYELAWVTIPVLIVGFTVIAYFAGFSLRGNNPTVNQINVVQVFPDSDIASVDSLIGIFSPRRTTYDVEMAGDFVMRPLPRVELGQFVFDDRAYKITETDAYRAEDIPVDAGIVTTFAATGYAPAVDYSGSMVWTLAEETETAVVTGSFSSDIELTDAVLLVKNSAFTLGDIAPNNPYEFDYSVQLQEPTWQTLGNNTDNSLRFRFGGRSGRTANFGINGDRVLCQRQVEVDTIAQIMQDYLTSCVEIDGFSSSTLQVRMFFLQAIINDLDFSGGRTLDGYIVGWSDTAPFSAQLPNYKPDIQQTSLYIFKLPGDVSAATELVRIAPGLMTWTVAGRLDPNTVRDTSPYDTTISANDQAIWRFMPVGEKLQNAHIQRLEVLTRTVGSRDILEVALWNWNTQDWDIQDFVISDRLSLNRLQALAYIGPNNAVEVRLKMLNEVDFVRASSVEVTLYGELP